MRTERSIRSVTPAPGLFPRTAGAALLLACGLLASAAPAWSQESAETPAAGAERAEDRVITGDHVVAKGDVVSSVAVVGGDLTIRGRVTGNAVVVDGDLILRESGIVLGDATVTGGRIVHDGGRVRGEMRVIEEAGAAAVAGDEPRRGAREADRRPGIVEERIDRRVRERSSWFGPIRRGFAGLISTVALGLVLAALGAALVFYGRPYLETVSDTLRSSTGRSAAVGLAAGFLVIPAFVVMVVALAVSIIGIPVLLIAVPLYPLVIAAGAAMGLLAGAHAIGERTAEQQGQPFQRRLSNSYAYLFAGLAMLLTPLIMADLISMTGFLDFLGTLLKIVTALGIWILTMAGFGAVILSRAGTRRTFVAPPPEAELDDELLFDDEPTSPPSSHV